MSLYRRFIINDMYWCSENTANDLTEKGLVHLPCHCVWSRFVLLRLSLIVAYRVLSHLVVPGMDVEANAVNRYKAPNVRVDFFDDFMLILVILTRSEMMLDIYESLCNECASPTHSDHVRNDVCEI